MRGWGLRGEGKDRRPCGYCAAPDHDGHLCVGKLHALEQSNAERKVVQDMTDDAGEAAELKYGRMRRLNADIAHAVRHADAVRRMEEALRRLEMEDR